MNRVYEMPHVRKFGFPEHSLQKPGKQRQKEHHVERSPFGQISKKLIEKGFLTKLLCFIVVVFSPFVYGSKSGTGGVYQEMARGLQGFRGNLFFLNQIIQVFTFYFFQIQNGIQVFLPESCFMQAGVGHDSGHSHVGKREPVVQTLHFEQLLGLFYSSFLKGLH